MTERDDPPSDRDLFHAAIGKVRKMPQDVHPPSAPPPAPLPRQTQLDERRVLDDMMSDAYITEEVQPGDVLCHLTPGISKQIMRRLRRGEYRREGTLDLHGLTVEQARQSLAAFMTEAKARDWRCVRIIHGKGLRSTNQGPILKSRLNAWLQQRKEVLAFCSAPPRDGGTGAVYALLRAAPGR
ncbi:MAG: Smr/MutS family protein [Thiotrichales bacterium]